MDIKLDLQGYRRMKGYKRSFEGSVNVFSGSFQHRILSDSVVTHVCVLEINQNMFVNVARAVPI